MLLLAASAGNALSTHAAHDEAIEAPPKPFEAVLAHVHADLGAILEVPAFLALIRSSALCDVDGAVSWRPSAAPENPG